MHPAFPHPTISVVLPYFNNAQTLAACLKSFVDQIGAQALEIIVVDDGDAPTAAAIAAAIPSHVPIEVFHSHRAGQSGATNRGIRQCRGDLVLLTCADIVATPHLLRSYLRTYGQHAQDVAVLGHIAYAPWLTMTPFMHFLATSNIQFDFDGIQAQKPVRGQMLYAPNCLVSKKALMEVGLFDEAFPYGFQDCDLGLRLEKNGLAFSYCPEAKVWHDHPNTIRQFARRQTLVHKHWFKMAQRHPELVHPAHMVAYICHYAPKVRELETCLRLAECAEMQASTASAHTAPLQTSLVGLFNTICSLAMVQGLLQDTTQLATVLPDILYPPAHRPPPLPHRLS